MAKRGRPARTQADGGMISSGRSEGGEHPHGRSSENDGPNAMAATGGLGLSAAPTAEDKLENFAEDLGRFLGTVQNRATSWLDQRQAIAEQLTQIRDTANHYLQQLAGEGARFAEAVQRGRRSQALGSATKRGPGRPPGSATAPSPTIPKRTMSAAARRRIGQAQKKRWAQLKKEQAGRP